MWFRYAILTALLWHGGTPAGACELKIAYINQAAAPFLSEAPPDSATPGLAIEIMNSAAASVGCKVTFARRPGKRVLAEVSAGQHAGALMYSFSEERSHMLVFPTVEGELETEGKLDPERRLARLTYYFYRPAGGKLEWDGQKLLHVEGAIGVNLGYAIGNQLSALGARVEEVGTTMQNLEKMQRGHLAGYAMYDYGVDTHLKEARFSTLEKLPLPLSRRDYYLAFSPKFYHENRELAEKIWDAIAQVREKLTSERLGAYAE